MAALLGRLSVRRKQSSSCWVALVTADASSASPHALKGDGVLFIWFSLWFISLIPLFLKVVLHPGGRASPSPCPVTSPYPLAFVCRQLTRAPACILASRLFCSFVLRRVFCRFSWLCSFPCLVPRAALPLLCGWPACWCFLSSSDSPSPHLSTFYWRSVLPATTETISRFELIKRE